MYTYQSDISRCISVIYKTDTSVSVLAISDTLVTVTINSVSCFTQLRYGEPNDRQRSYTQPYKRKDTAMKWSTAFITAAEETSPSKYTVTGRFRYCWCSYASGNGDSSRGP